MPKRLSDEERAHRIVARVELRHLKRKGKCANATCKREIEKGGHSLRYMTVVHGRAQEVGICIDCIKRLWPHVEELVGKISMSLASHGFDTEPETPDEDILPDNAEDRARMDDKLYEDLGIS
ncbi:hypothetical protein LCGC14_0331970 [marine sediment metagenome]|uniref:Uncharacterized protein n=1 Tax=marine sediment metagenome TaxID=412755 RepID=A0A0F9WNI9_9ZZZZ